jgi:hypothetical protein
VRGHVENPAPPRELSTFRRHELDPGGGCDQAGGSILENRQISRGRLAARGVRFGGVRA